MHQVQVEIIVGDGCVGLNQFSVCREMDNLGVLEPEE